MSTEDTTTTTEETTTDATESTTEETSSSTGLTVTVGTITYDKEQNFTIEQGTDHEHIFQIVNRYIGDDGSQTDTVMDLSGYSAALQVRKSYSSTEAVDTLSTEAGDGTLEIYDATNGLIKAHFKHSRTCDYPARDLVYDLEISVGEDDEKMTYRPAKGVITVDPEVTKVG